MIRRYIIVAEDSIKGFDEEIAKLEREWGAEEIEPCEDCISREALKKVKFSEETNDYESGWNDAIDSIILHEPSVTPKQPCEDWYDVPSDEMTLEQAKQAVKDLRKKLSEYLEQEPCEDCISREDVMHILDEVGGDFDTPREAVVPIDYIADEVAKLPSVTPTRRKGLDKTEKNCNTCGQKCAIKYHGCSNWIPIPPSYQGESEG